MTNVLIIGASGVIGQRVTKKLLENTDDSLTLMACNTSSVSIDEKCGRIVQGDVIDDKPLNAAMEGNSIVLVAADSNLAFSVQRIIDAMKIKSINRLIFITSMGLYNEIPVTDGASGNLTQNALLQPYRAAVEMIENSGLNYTILRPVQFDEGRDVSYEISSKGETPKNKDVSYDSTVDYIVKLVNDDMLDSKENLAICRK